MSRTQILPDLARPDVDVAVVSSWTVGTPAHQRAAVEAAAAAREGSLWPEGLLSVSYFVGFDGEKVLTYAQWASEDAVSGLDGPESIAYRLYRNGLAVGETRVPGCIVFVEIETEGADVARRWVDSVFAALAAETVPHPGGISADFHISVDGKRVLNYAGWTDAEAHREAIGDPGAPGIARSMSPEWHRVQNTPGATPVGFTRYRLGLTVTAPSV
jgi:quinol monooxygenase YgiN